MRADLAKIIYTWQKDVFKPGLITRVLVPPAVLCPPGGPPPCGVVPPCGGRLLSPRPPPLSLSWGSVLVLCALCPPAVGACCPPLR